MKRYIISFVFICSIISVYAQQYPLYSLYMFNPSIINPAYTATSTKTAAMAQSRIQWVDFDGAPVTNLLSLNKPLEFLNSGVGISLMNDIAGPVNHTAFYADYSFRFKVSPKSHVSLGLRAGCKYYMVNLSELSTQFDPVFQEDQESSFLPAFGFGAFYYSHDYYIGVAIPELVKSVDVFRGNSASTMLPVEERNFLLSGGYVFYLEQYDLILKPTFLGRLSYGAPATFDIGLHTILREKLWWGFNYRFRDCITPFVQVQINDNLRVAYSYDYTLSELRTYNSGTHEIGIIYELYKSPDKIISPRFF